MAEVVIAYVIGRFNPRAREGRDLETIGHTIDFTEVSIHAPARGATRRKTRLFKQANVSIHAPARGATPRGSAEWRARRRFNPRAREGRDCHAPRFCCSGTRFNPRAREGRDEAGRRDIHACQMFQSTRPRGARQESQCIRFSVFLVSIHAPARGATRDVLRHAPVMRVSIHAPARGATPRAALLLFRNAFQSTRPRGARPASSC